MTTKPTIETVAKDIRELLEGVKTGTHKVSFTSPELLSSLGLRTANAFRRTLSADTKVRPEATFYASEIGSKCYRQLWYKYHKPELAEKLSASVAMKFLYGSIIEEVVLKLAELAGHEVSKEQESVEHTQYGVTVRGRIDAVIDDAVVDVKSVSTYGFKDFRDGLGGDKFGYKQQLAFYHWKMGYAAYPKRGFIAVDKQLGHIEYCPEPVEDVGFDDIFQKLDRVVNSTNGNPFDRLQTVVDGVNLKLGVECGYCGYKYECWFSANGGRGPRAFKYSGKVTWLVQVNKEPRVPEITFPTAVGVAKTGDGTEDATI